MRILLTIVKVDQAFVTHTHTNTHIYTHIHTHIHTHTHTTA